MMMSDTIGLKTSREFVGDIIDLVFLTTSHFKAYIAMVLS